MLASFPQRRRLCAILCGLAGGILGGQAMLHITPGLLQDFIFWLAVLTGGLLGGFTGFFLPEIAAGEIRDGRSLLRGAGAGLLHHWAAGQALPGAAALGVLHPARILGDQCMGAPGKAQGMGSRRLPVARALAALNSER